MTAKRGKPEIVFDILAAVQKNGGKIKPTRLLYSSNLSYARLKLYLESLIKQGLVSIERTGEKNLILLSQKGYHFIDEYRKMKQLIDSFGI
jgi:predicted transcriptional regulator